jgi:hypothetical protein
MEIEATYSGLCIQCKQPYVIGDSLRLMGGDFQHTTCPTVVPLEAYAVPEPEDLSPFKVLADSIAPYLTHKIDESKLAAEVEAMVRSQVKDIVVPQNITIQVNDREWKLEGITPHKNFKDLAYLASKRKNIYLHGNPGFGKSEAAFQIAKLFNLEFNYITLVLQTSDTRLIGYKDAHGVYHSTPLRQFYERGGLFLIDEVDRASGNTLTALNGGLANGRGTFPDGLIPRHKDFVAIATGNTTGRGANLNFPDCRPLDEAFRDRFFFLEWEDDHAFERTIALSINNKAEDWIVWVQLVREFVKKNGIRLNVSPRATYEGADFLHDTTLTLDKIAYGTLWRGVDQDTVRRVVNAVPLPKVKTRP